MPRRRSTPGPRARPHSARATQEKALACATATQQQRRHHRHHHHRHHHHPHHRYLILTNHAFQRYRDVDHGPAHQSQAIRRCTTSKDAWAAVTGVRRYELPDRPAHPRDHSFPHPPMAFCLQSHGRPAISHSASRGASLPPHLDHGEMTRPPGGSGHLIIDTRPFTSHPWRLCGASMSFTSVSPRKQYALLGEHY